MVAADARYFIELIDREIAFYRKENRFRSEADRAAMLGLFEKARRVYEQLR